MQICMYLHVINIEAESELVWATIPGQLRLLFPHLASRVRGLHMRECFAY